MHTVVIVVHLMIVSAMIALVLLQRSEGGGLGIGGGGGFLTNRGTGNVLTRATAFLGAAFFATSLVLSIIAGMERRPTSILPGGGVQAPSAPGGNVPLGQGGSLLDQLRGPEQPASPPSGPAVPQSR